MLVDAIPNLKKTNDRVLFQNAEGNINAGVCFNDPDIEFKELSWFNILAEQMTRTLNHQELNKEELIFLDEESGLMSCYAGLHRYSECPYLSQII